MDYGVAVMEEMDRVTQDMYCNMMCGMLSGDEDAWKQARDKIDDYLLNIKDNPNYRNEANRAYKVICNINYLQRMITTFNYIR